MFYNWITISLLLLNIGLIHYNISMKQCVVLHITESVGGGLTLAISQYVANAPNCFHILCCPFKPADSIGVDLYDVADKYIEFDFDGFLVVFSIREMVKKYNPDIIHLHSSFAGFFGRLALPFNQKVIYTPHGFSFFKKRCVCFKARWILWYRAIFIIVKW